MSSALWASALPPTIIAPSVRVDLDPRTAERIERASEELQDVPAWAEEIETGTQS
jgi:hypothetical protein